MTSDSTFILLVLLGVIVAFMICRELVCWYWKINRTTELLESILCELREHNGKEPNEPVKPPKELFS